MKIYNAQAIMHTEQIIQPDITKNNTKLSNEMKSNLKSVGLGL